MMEKQNEVRPDHTICDRCGSLSKRSLGGHVLCTSCAQLNKMAHEGEDGQPLKSIAEQLVDKHQPRGE